MKNIKIFPKDWMQIHPYKQSTPIDSYYTSLANRIYDMMVETELINSFEPEDTKQICIRMAAYFEDVISGLGIWRAFITKYKELFGKYLPFYTPDDHYYDDEVNYEDVRFLLWHFTQQYHGFKKGTFVSPDNPANESTSLLIYNMFCDEWTTAPDNPRMKMFFDKQTRYDNQEKYEPLLFWFHYHSYLFPDANRELTEYTQTLWNENKGSSQEQLSDLIMDTHQKLAYVGKTSMLALTSPQWLALIFPEDHPDHAFMREIAEQSQAVIPEEIVEQNKKEYENFTAIANGQPILYFQKSNELESFLKEKMPEIAKADYQLPGNLKGKKLALYATPQEGAQIMSLDLELIKDPNNPFYNKEKAEKQALSYFIVKHCSIYMLKLMMEKGMLADAQTKSLKSRERGKAIIQENWEFLARYFIKEYAR